MHSRIFKSLASPTPLRSPLPSAVPAFHSTCGSLRDSPILVSGLAGEPAIIASCPEALDSYAVFSASFIPNFFLHSEMKLLVSVFEEGE